MITANNKGYEMQRSNYINKEVKIKKMYDKGNVVYYMEFPSSLVWYTK